MEKLNANLKVELSGSVMTFKVCLPREDKIKREPKAVLENRVVKIRGGFYAVVTNKNNKPSLKQCNEAIRKEQKSVPEGYIVVTLGEPYTPKEGERGVNEHSWIQESQRKIYKTSNDVAKREFGKVLPEPNKMGVLDNTKKVQVYTNISVGFREEAHPIYENTTVCQFFVQNGKKEIHYVGISKSEMDETLKSLSNVGIHLLWADDTSEEGVKFSRKVASLKVEGEVLEWVAKEIDEKQSYSALNAKKIEELSQARDKNRLIKVA